MIVWLRNPDREIAVDGPLTAAELVERLELNPESVLVIADGELVPGGRRIDDSAAVEVRRVISGGGR